MRKKTKFILASASPRRQELLRNITEDFQVIVSDVEENTVKTVPSEVVEELSAIKAQAVYKKCIEDNIFEGDNQAVVIGADTIVEYEGDILGKPVDEEDAKNMLSMLADRDHHVYTGVTLIIYTNGETKCNTFSICTTVTFSAIDKYEIQEYVASKDPLDKAGSYGIQGIFSKHIKGIQGDYYNVMGLPVNRLYTELKSLNLI